MLNDVHSMNLSYARDVKTEKVRDGDVQVAPMIWCYRGHELVSTIVVGGVSDAYGILDVAKGAIAGYSADVVSVMFEGWQATTRVHPLTGRPWGDGDMQKLVEHHNGIEKGWVSDGMTVTTVNRAGDILHSSQRLRIVGRKVRWKIPTHFTLEESGGPIPENLIRFMNGPTISSRMHAIPALRDMRLEAGPEISQARDDVGITKLLMERFAPRIAVGLNPGEEGTLRYQVITAGLLDNPLFDVDVIAAEGGEDARTSG